MGLLDKLLGGKKNATTEYTKLSFLMMALQQRMAVTSRECDVCQRIFQSTTQEMVAIDDPGRAVLDLGGYCSRCRKYVCPEHARLGPQTMGAVTAWVPVCASCSGILCPEP